MADSELTQERLGQLVRAGLPFNPVSGVELVGDNLNRLQRGMRMFGWDDPRFVTMAQARGNGWSVKPESPNVQVVMRDPETGAVEKFALFNAASVEGMTPIAAMLEMSASDMALMSERGAAAEVEDEEVVMSPARSRAKDPYLVIEANYNFAATLPKDGLAADDAHDMAMEDAQALRSIQDKGERAVAAATIGEIAEKQVAYRQVLVNEHPDLVDEVAQALRGKTSREAIRDAAEKDAGGDRAVDSGENAGIAGEVTERGFAVLAPYWLDGLHNAEGVDLAEEINRTIKKTKIGQDKDAIEKLMSVYPRAQALGLDVVPFERYRDDPHRQADLARPRSLLNGELVRDKEGAYRPAAGGKPVVVDNGEAVVLKSKSAQGYEAAVELALAKGWTAIELSGKPSMLAEAWLEAKLKGLEVVNYVPTEKDKARYAKRLAEEKAKQIQNDARAAEQGPEQLEVRPFVDANGQNKEARITYTVSATGMEPQTFGDPLEAAKQFVSLPLACKPAVVRSVTRVDGSMIEDPVAGVEVDGAGGSKRAVDAVLDKEFAQAVSDLDERERLAPVREVVTTGRFDGPIVAVEGDYIGQKVGRDPKEIKWHKVMSLSGPVPALGESASIEYADGVGVVKGEKSLNRDVGGGRGITR